MRKKEGYNMVIALYVDDLILADNYENAVRCVNSELAEMVEVKDVGEGKGCLRLHILPFRLERKLCLIQTKHATDILSLF